jgi:Protein of unknown function (DUF2752)
MTKDQATATFAAVAMGAICMIVYAFPPAQYGFYPVCPIYHWTGWLCPGCGATRALHALLHGELTAALAFNPFLVLIAPFIAGVAVWQLLSLARTGRFATIALGSRQAFTMAALMLMFGFARNLT